MVIKPSRNSSLGGIYISNNKDFKKQKLSVASLDDFVLRYADDTFKVTVPYTTADNRSIKFAPSKANRSNGYNELMYLIGQTLPVHDGKSYSYPISMLACIINEQGQKELWTKDSKVIAQFIKISESLGFMETEKDDKGFTVHCNGLIHPVVHREKNQKSTKPS